MNIDWFAPLTVAIIGAILLAVGMGFIGKVRRRDAFKTAGWIIGAIGLIGMFVMPVSDVRNLAGGLTVAGETDELSEASVTSCPDTQVTTMYLKVLDKQASTLTYLPTTTYISDSGTWIVDSVDSSGYNSQGSFNCGDHYKITGVTNASNTASFVKEVDLKRANEYFETDSYNIDWVQARVKDLATDSYLNQFNGSGDSADNTTAFLKVNNTYIQSDAARTAIAVGADGYLDYEIYVKTVGSNAFAGDLDMWLCVDVGSDNEWQEPDVSADGKGLSDAKSVLVNKYPDDSTGSLISAADYCYAIGDGKAIGDTTKTIGFYIKARSGQNPDTTNDNVVISLLSAGRFLSNEDVNTVKSGIYTDGSTQTLVTQIAAVTPTITINVS